MRLNELIQKYLDKIVIIRTGNLPLNQLNMTKRARKLLG